MFKDIKAFLSSLIKRLSSKKIIKKFFGIIVICLLTVLIPITIAICYFQSDESDEKNVSSDISVSLFDAENSLMVSDVIEEDNIEASHLADILYKLSSTKTKISKPNGFAKKPNMSFTITRNSISSTFKCYFEENVKSSYIEDQNGAFYRPNGDTYSEFLSSEYAESIYKESVPPILNTEIGETLLPKQVLWNYTLNNQTEKISKNYEETQEMLTYRITGAIAFKFSRSPDICNITVTTSAGDTAFSGKLEDLISLTAEENSELSVYIDAKWEKNGKFSSYGEQQYEFKIICTEPSSFNVSANEAFGGEIILLSVSNVTNTESIIYTPSIISQKGPSASSAKALQELYSYKPVFVTKNSNAYALLPIPASIPETEFSFSLSCGISKSDFTLKLKTSEPKEITINPEDTSKNIVLSDLQKASFLKILSDLKYSNRDILLLNEGFLLPKDYGFTQNHSYNSKINNSFTLLASSFTANSTDGASVKSANIGTVLSVGRSELLGNYVVIDHGMGLCTWYCGLSDTSVSEKDILKKGDVIGRAGSTSLLCENGVNILCSVGGIFIDPEDLIIKS